MTILDAYDVSIMNFFIKFIQQGQAEF